MTQPIHRQLRDVRRALHLNQYQLADLMGVAQCTISAWDRGYKSSSIPDADLYARTVHQRLIVTLNGSFISELLPLFPNLADFRKARGASQMDLARRMWASRGTVANIEIRIRTGTAVRLATVVPYLGGLGCVVGLTPADRLERAA